MKRTVIITGASDGIGRAIAHEFSKRGYALGLIARRSDALETVKAECMNRGADSIHSVSVDVTNEIEFESALATLDEHLGGTEIFIANAGVTGRTSFKEDSWSQVKHTLQVNVMAAIHGLEVMKLKMLSRGHGVLCGVSSIAGARGMPTGGAYSTSKAALTTHLEAMRLDLKPHQIDVVTIAPGFIKTPLTEHNKGKMPFLMESSLAAEIFVAGVIAKKAWVVAPLPYRVIYPILQMLPRPIFDFLMTRIYRNIRGN